MSNCLNPIAHPMRLSVLTATIATLGACGGGSDDPASTPVAAAPVAAPAAPASAPAPAPAPAPTFFDHGSTTGRAVGAAPHVFDVDAAVPLRLSLPDASSLYPGQARATDAAAGTQT